MPTKGKVEAITYHDSKGVVIEAGDDGQYRGMQFHVIKVDGELCLEKWCGLYKLPLNNESARIYEITKKKGWRR